jgi:hypothetical protein
MTGKKHPTEEAAPHSNAITAETAVRLCQHMMLTESEALSILNAPDVTPEEVSESIKADIHAIAHAFSPTTVAAVTSDPKIELTDDKGAQIAARAERVRVASSACDKLQFLHDATEASVHVDAGVLQTFASEVVPQIKARARANSAVRTTYSALLAYQHARYPGHRSGTHAVAPVAPPGPTEK